MHRKFDVRRYLTAFFVGIFAIVGSIVAIDAPARAAIPADVSASKIDNYATLNGTSQGFGRPSTSFGTYGTNFAIEMWLKPSTLTNTRFLFVKQNSLELWLEDSEVKFKMQSTANAWQAIQATGVKVVSGEWQHISLVKQAGTATLYLNGSEAWTVTNATNIPSAGLASTNAYLGIGATNWNGSSNDSVPVASYFSGSIDEVKIWNTFRTKEQVYEGMHSRLDAPATGLLGYWDFNGSISPLYDYSANGFDLTASNSPTMNDVKTVTSFAGKTVVKFPRSYLTSSNGWSVPSGVSLADVLIVGGGGGGGGRSWGGGGGAGAAGYGTNRSMTPGSSLAIQVGQGGKGGGITPETSEGENGQSSIFGAATAIGGGGGGGYGYSPNVPAISTGKAGGSAGGHGEAQTTIIATTSNQQPVSGYSVYGSAGGAMSVTPSVAGSGGGGAGGVGGTVSTSGAPGAGGAGKYFDITGSSTFYAAGGGGGGNGATVALGGSSIGGNGGAGSATAPTAGAANTGSGGGGVAWFNTAASAGASGGSGIVIVAYAPTDDNYMNFDGTSQYAVASGAQVIPATGNFTAEAWVNPAASPPSLAMIFSQGTGGNKFYAKRTSSGAFIINRGDAGEINCGQLPQETWSHVAISVSGSNMSCFINGTQTNSSSSFSTTSIGTGFYVGQFSQDPNSGEKWKGGLDQVKVWNTALNQAAVARSMHMHAATDSAGTVAGLTNLYDFNESGSDSTVNDRVGSLSLATTNTPGRTSIVETSALTANTAYIFKRTFLTAWGGWVTPAGLTGTATLLAVGGGGSGGTRHAGGGGAGELVYNTSVALTSGTVVAAMVGQGGLGRLGGSNRNDNALSSAGRVGQSSKFGSTVVLGGGGGEGGLNPATAGGSSGGRDEPGSVVAVGSGSGSQNTGAQGAYINSNTGLAGGGGGGAGSAGYLGTNAAGGQGGDGIEYSISGAAICYAAGGGGGVSDASAAGGPGGDGCANAPSSGGAGSSKANASPALANTGSGGGGGGFDPGTAKQEFDSGSGGSGVLIVSIKTANTITFNANGGTSSLSVQNVTLNATANLTTASGTVVRSGYTFTGWNTQANNYGTAYAEAAPVTPNADMTLYAQWIPNAPVLYYNFSDRDSTYEGNASVTNLGSNATYSATKIGTLTHDDSTGKLSFSGGTNTAGPYIDIADISSTQFADNGITIDFEADFGTATNWERVFDFSAVAPGAVSSNILAYREGTTNNIWFEIYDGTTSLGGCGVIDGLLNTNFARWTISQDGVNCKIYKDGVAQTTSVRISGTTNTTSAWTAKPRSAVTWTSNFIGRSGYSLDSQFAGTIRSIRLYAGVMTAAQVGEITYRTINFNANYTGSSSLTSRYTSGKTTLQTAPTRTGYTFSGWYDNIVSTSGTLIGGSGVVYSPISSSMNLFGAWAANVGSPAISSQPANITKSAGQTATFTVTASSPDSGTLSYQWEVSANNGSTWMNVADGTGGATSSYTTASLVSADLGKQFRVKVTNTLSGSTAVTTSTAATLTIGLDKVNVNFDELNFDFANVLHISGTTGKAQGNKVLFLNVTTKAGIQVDALVTTETLTNATITNYETGARAGGANSYFQTDVDFSAANGFAQFKFDFYKHGVAGSAGNPCTVALPDCTGATKVVIQNVNVSAIDIDYYQWNDFTQAESYTLAGNTKLKECLITVANAAAGGTCAARTAPTTFPADMRFQGTPDTARTNDPVDMAIVTYADIETFRIKFGRDRAGSPNYYGVAFKALDWGTAVPQTKGGSNYTISYNANSPTSGSQAGTHVGAAGSSFTVLNAGTAVKTGYTFAGWATSSTATTATYAASSKVTMPGSNLTLYAVWTPIKYTLTYNANGGTGAPAAGSYDSGTTITLPAGPTRAGYVFGGWDTVINSGTGNANAAAGSSYTTDSSNVTLYAKWTIANGTLAYNGNNGTTTEVSVTAAGNTTTTVASGSNSNRAGYDFVGWNSKADGTGTSYAVGSTFTLQATVTTTIYAQWTLSKYTLVFNVNGGVGTPQSQSYVAGATTTMPVSNPTRAGYTFGGWNSLAAGTGTAYNGSFQMPGNNLTLYAKWNAITYNVTYNNNSATYSGATGSVTDSVNYTSAESVTVKAATGLSNTTGVITYVFTGWNTQADGLGTDYMPSSTFAMPANSITLYAMWVDASIEIAYNANGGTGAPANANTTLNSNFTINSTPPVRAGYAFGGWNVQDGSPGSGPHAAGATITPNSNEVLVAQWTAVNYTITYNSGGGSTAPTDPGNKHIDDTINVNSNEPTKAGYTFLGWKDGAGNIYPAGGTFKMPAGDVTLTAQWQGNAYTLNYDSNGGSGAPASETRNYTATANLSLVEPVRTGYTFQGWNTLVGGGGTAKVAGASFQMPNSNTTLFAQWTVNNFLLAYNTQGGSTAPTGGSTNYNVEVTVDSGTPTKTGYSFAGWNTAANGSGTTYLQSSKFRMPNANVTLYAQWTKTAFTLYYNTNGGNGVFSSQPVKYSESVTVDSTTPTKTGYTFSGWNTAANGTSGNDFNPMSVFTLSVESNVTLYAKWTPVSYSIAYNANSGSGAPTGGSHNFGATVTTANKGSINLASHRFIGWNTRADGSGTTYIENATFAMPAENVILYAQWISSLYQIAYNANGGSGGPDGAIANDTSTYNIDPIEPVRPGHTFEGWKLADSTPTGNTLMANSQTLAGSFVVSGNELLVAQWTLKTITVTYDLNGGSRGSALSQASGDYNTDVTLAASTGITRANFQFVGWSTTPDGSGTTYVDGSTFKLPAENVILYAKWAPVYYVIEYNPAGGTGEPADQFATPSSTVAIATQEPTKTGYEFDKWTEVSQGTDFNPGSSLTMPSSNVVLVANYTVRAAGVPGSGSGSNTGVIDPGTKPISKPKQLVLSVYFKGDSPVLTSNTKIALKKLAALAKSYGRANNITIYGRVKETNDKSYDLRLSKARASNVAAFLKKYGVTGVFKVYAKGISPENTYKSRRVDMKLWWAK